MFTPKPPLPPKVQRERLYDRVIFDSGKTSFDVFSSTPSGSETEQNYDQIPLATNLNVVFLGLSFSLTHSVLVGDGTIDPQKVINTLADGIIKITTDQKRTTELRHPLKDVLNLSNLGVSAFHDAANTTNEIAISVPATNMRSIDELFYVKDQESWGMSIELNTANMPAQSDWPNAPLGVFGEVPIAKLSDKQLDDYIGKYEEVRGYGANYSPGT